MSAADNPLTNEAVMAHVLFMDIVSASKRFTDDQRRIVGNLQNKVRDTAPFRAAHDRGQLIAIPTGDGMALVFLDDIEAPLRCAIEIAHQIRSDDFKLRMGIHSGPVYIVEDINGQKNVSGAGINRAQRIMDCGDGGHILLSDSAADSLRQLSSWSSRIHDIGPCRAKDGWPHCWSYEDGNTGNTALPHKSKRYEQRHRLITLGIPALLILLAAAGGLLAFRGQRARVDKNVPVALTYSVEVKPERGASFTYTPDTPIPPRSGLKFHFTAPSAGVLYLLNRGPSTAQGHIWHWLFPYAAFQNGSGALSAGQNITLPADPAAYYEVDENSGSETVFLAWSNAPIPELDALDKQIQSSDGRLTSPQGSAAASYFESHQSEVNVSAEGAGSKLSAPGPTLVSKIVLRHK